MDVPEKLFSFKKIWWQHSWFHIGIKKFFWRKRWYIFRRKIYFILERRNFKGLVILGFKKFLPRDFLGQKWEKKSRYYEWKFQLLYDFFHGKQTNRFCLSLSHEKIHITAGIFTQSTGIFFLIFAPKNPDRGIEYFFQATRPRVFYSL